MRWIVVIWISLSFIPSALALDQGLTQINDLRLIHILNNAEIVARHDRPPVAARIYRLKEHGECSPGKPATCPLQTLLIATSEYGEYPEQMLFKLPKAHGWEFLGWRNIPTQEGREHFVTFQVKRQSPSSLPKTGWWIDTYYEIGVNRWQGYMKEIPAPTVQMR